MGKRIRAEEELEICNLYKTKQKNFKEIKQICNRSESSISKILRKYNISTSERIWKTKYTYNENLLNDLNNPDVCYFLGFLYADGCNYTKKNSVTIALKEDDREILDKFRILFSTDKPLYYGRKSTGSNQWIFTITHRYFSKKLSDLGITARKSNTITFPTWLSEDMYSHFIRGYFDGDGCISRNSYNAPCFNLIGTESFLLTIQIIINKELNLNSTKLYTPTKYKNTDSNIKYLSYAGKQAYKIRDWLYKDANLYLQRKYNKFYN